MLEALGVAVTGLETECNQAGSGRPRVNKADAALGGQDQRLWYVSRARPVWCGRAAVLCAALPAASLLCLVCVWCVPACQPRSAAPASRERTVRNLVRVVLLKQEQTACRSSEARVYHCHSPLSSTSSSSSLCCSPTYTINTLSTILTRPP
jgi:hypothetical protein